MAQTPFRFVLGLLGALTAGAASAQAPAAGSATDSLAPALQETLRAEMRDLQAAMVQMVPHLVTGDWPSVVELAERIEGRFVLKQDLTAAQRQALHQGLPEGFLALDRRFHDHAAQLAQAARKHNADLAVFSFYKLAEGCVQCHQTYARGRFPGMSDTGEAGGAEHGSP